MKETMQMATEPKGTVGAVSHEYTITATQQEDIDWDTVEANVNRLQARIVKAMQAGKGHKAQALQHLLTHSRSGKLLAARRVTDIQGTRNGTG
jgi:RNA-directed DNA polymerase